MPTITHIHQNFYSLSRCQTQRIDDESKKLNLPAEYGAADLPAIIQDRDFKRNGSFAYLGSMMDSMRGMKGNTVLVNGVVNPVLKAKKSLLRLRVLLSALEASI
jgi:bilirubin oxidase